MRTKKCPTVWLGLLSGWMLVFPTACDRIFQFERKNWDTSDAASWLDGTAGWLDGAAGDSVGDAEPADAKAVDQGKADWTFFDATMPDQSAPDAIRLDGMTLDQIATDLTSNDLTSNDLTSNDLTPLDLAQPDLPPRDLTPSDLSGPDLPNPDSAPPDVSGPDLSTPDLSTPDLSKPDSAPPDVSGPDLSTPDSAPPDLTPPAPSVLFLSGNDAYVLSDFGSPEEADAFCQDEADKHGVEGQFYAIISQNGQAARDRLAHIGYPVFNVNGVVIEQTDLWGGQLESAADVKVDGTAILFTVHVWTGTLADGSASNKDCNDWQSDAQTKGGTVGSAQATDGNWLNNGINYCQNARHLYCISQDVPN